MEEIVLVDDEFTQISESNLPTVGIDVGSTFMSVAFKNGNHVEVLANRNGRRLTPCAISFSDNDTLIGDVALSQTSHNASNTILNILNFLGRGFNDPEISDLIARSPVKIVNNSGVIGFDVEIGDGKRKILNTVEAMSMLLSELRNVASTYLGQEVNRAVISVPGFFDKNRRNAMGNAAKLAGFTEIKLITDVLAACRSYREEILPSGNILVFNMGESSVNATIIRNNNGGMTVRSSSHNENFGGKNINEVVRHFLISRFNEKHGTNLQDSPEIISKLETQVKTLKHNFSKSIKEKVFIENLSNGNGLDISLTKVRFDILCNDVLTSAFEHVEIALERAQLTNSDINCVALSGGSANLSKLREMFSEEFEDVASNDIKEISFHEIIVKGAAFEASMAIPTSIEEMNTALEEVAITNETSSGNSSGVRRKTRSCAPTASRRSDDSSEVAIGIDLGTTNSCVAVVRNSRVEIIANSMGNKITPSFVAFTEDERLVGDAARSQFIENPLNTIFDAKRLIGRKLNDGEIQKRLQDWPFTVSSRNGNPQLDVSFQSKIRHISPEEISAAVLTEMKTAAEAFLGRTVNKAVITVPAYFNDSQRQATLDAGKIAKLQVLKIINEPTAAAIAFGVDRKIEESKNVLVFDLGGGTFDVAVLAISGGNFQVLAVSGNMNLGGGDFDSRLVDYFIEQFNKTHPIELRKNPVALAKLRTECEKIKINLSSSKTVKFTIENLIDDVQFTSSITRARFEDICSDLIEATLEPVEDVLKATGLDKSQIHEVVLAGGGTRMPKIQEQLVEFFDGKNLNTSINPDEAVAYGAALHAAVIVGETSVDDILLTDVTPHSLGLDVELDCFTYKLIHKNTPLPATELGYFSTLADNQPNVYIHIYEGENHKSEDNRYLGQFNLDNIQKAPRHVPIIEVTYSLDENAILHVTAKDCTTNVSKSIDVIANKGRLNDSEIARMITEGLEFETATLNENNRNKLRIDLANYCYMLKRSIRAKRQNIDSGSFDVIDQLCNRTISWTDVTPRIDSEECERRKLELEDLFQRAST